jgi:hypothetical protein
MLEQGLQVFLDVDNLANSGAFDDQLWNHLQARALLHFLVSFMFSFV